MDAGRREERRRKYLRLGTGELAAASVFLVAAQFLVVPRLTQPQDRMALWSALIPLLFVLVSAGVYWLLARAWVERELMPRGVAATYRVLRVASVLILAGGLAGLIVWWPNNIAVALSVAGFGPSPPPSSRTTSLSVWRTPSRAGSPRSPSGVPQLVADMHNAGD